MSWTSSMAAGSVRGGRLSSFRRGTRLRGSAGAATIAPGSCGAPARCRGEQRSSGMKDNIERSRFELDVGGQIVFADYARTGDTVVIRHVEAAVPLRGT